MQFKYMQSIMDRRRAAKAARFAQSVRGRLWHVCHVVAQIIVLVCIACAVTFVLWLEVTLAIVAFG